MSSRFGNYDEEPALDLIDKLKLLENKLRYLTRYATVSPDTRRYISHRYMTLKDEAESWLLKHGQHVKYDEAQRNIVDALEYINNLVRSRGETLFWMAQMCLDLAQKIAKTWGETGYGTQTPDNTDSTQNPYLVYPSIISQ